ncbi:MAG: type IV pilus secretin PilQ [Chromatiales bacterium]|nr:type IV pilus secretin PilQ [Chromatiales bacterium]
MSSVPAPKLAQTPAVARYATAQRLWLTLTLLALVLVAPAVSANTLQDISYSTLPGDRVELTFKFSEPASEPLSFTIDDPARIALDFANTDNGLKERNVPIGIGVTRSVTAVDAKGRTRVVINLAQLVGYQTRVQGNEVVVALGSSAADANFDMPAAGAGKTSTPAAVSTRGDEQRVTNVDFRRGGNGEARIMINLSDPRIPVDLRDQQGEIVLNVVGASLAKELERRLDVSDFATPVQTIDVFETDGNTRIVIKAAGDYDQLAYQSNDVYTVEVKEYREELVEERREQVWEGEKLSLNFQDIEVRSVLQLIADFTSLNVVVSDSVQGNITLRLKNVPWDQALDIILKTKGLGMRQNGNVLLIAPAEEIAAREKQELEDQQSIEKLLPLRTELIQINYAKASDIAGLLIASKALEGAEGEEGSNALATVLSSRGSVMVDQRTNTLLVRDTEPSLVAVRRLIGKLDIPVRQVLIESRIVIASDDFSRELGVRFGVNDQGDPSSDSNRRLYTSGSLNGTTQQINGEDLELADRLNVDMPVTNPAGSFGLALAKLPLGLLLELELSAAQAESKAEVVSSPRVITSNQKQAVIRQGVEIPYLEATSSGAASVSFKEAVLKLEVTPAITPDDRVNMDLAVHKDNVGELFAGIPSIDTRSVETLVLVDNGQTVVLGGIYETETSRDVRRVPFFGDIPVVGALFRSTSQTSDKSELLIFVTPKIISENLKLVR